MKAQIAAMSTSLNAAFNALPKRHGGKAASPFRYPGGKGFLSPLLELELSRRFPSRPPNFAEPFCGGAGAALNLLIAGKIDNLHLNDADIRIFCAWKAILSETDRFIETLLSTEANLHNWNKYLKKVYDANPQIYDFDVGFGTFFINRTSRSGVVIGSGPIGGYSQTGKWTISARYYQESLARRIKAIGAMKESISLYNEDGLDFCKSLQTKADLRNTFLFIDPPYVKAGSRLYYNGMTPAKHRELAEWLQSMQAPHWLLTYDDHPDIRKNYEHLEDRYLSVQYSLGRKRTENELLYMS